MAGGSPRMTAADGECGFEGRLRGAVDDERHDGLGAGQAGLEETEANSFQRVPDGNAHG